MKKIIQLSLLSACLLSVAACHKKTTCRCSGGLSGMGISEDMGNLSRSSAQAKCASYNTDSNVVDGYSGCHLE